MPYNRPLILKVVNRKDFSVLAGILFVLAVIAAMLSPQAVLLTIIVLLLFGAGWFAYTLDSAKVNDVKLISVIFPDGRVRLESGQATEINGFLSGQQWCTHHLAVLRYSTRGKYRYLAVLSVDQKKDEFRRLKVWLRQDFCGGSGEKLVSDI